MYLCKLVLREELPFSPQVFQFQKSLTIASFSPCRLYTRTYWESIRMHLYYASHSEPAIGAEEAG